MPRATTAAWEVMPPRAVRMPAASSMPFRSSGEVSMRTRIARWFFSLSIFSASSAKNTTGPVAAPGDAGSPFTMTLAFFIAVLSKTGWSSSSSLAGSQRSTAVFSSIRPSRSMSMAILTIAAPVRLPLRHWSIQSLPSWIVNSMSCISLKYCSRWCCISLSSLYTAGITSSSEGYLLRRSASDTFCALAQRREPSMVICWGVRMPATTSSPCALIRYSPLKRFSPVAASREKATPVAELSPMLPNTIACTDTAVPHSAGMLLSLR